MTYIQRAEKYFSKHPMFNSAVHVSGGIAIGLLLTYPFAGPHPVRWAFVFGVLALLGHIYAATNK